MGLEYPKLIKEAPKDSSKESFDDLWYYRFREIGSFQDFEYLTGDGRYREDQKNSFLAGEIDNPTLDYPELESFDFAGREQKLLELKKEILENEKNEVVRQLYRWKINEKIAQLRMLKCSKEGNDRKFSRYSKFVYGKPEEEIYRYSLGQIKGKVDKKILEDDVEISSVAKKLKEELMDQSFLENENINQDDYSFEEISVSKDKTEYLAEEIKKHFEEALINLGIDGWKIIIDDKSKISSISVSFESKEVKIPEKKKLIGKELDALISHEIKSHVFKSEKGERSRLKLLSLGLDRHYRGMEGIAGYNEQIAKGAEDFTGFDNHFAISLAIGIDGKKRTFREVYEILKDYYFISSKKEKAEALKSAESYAWKQCVRVFRGTTCKTPGACLTKDIIYREGNIGVWNLMKSDSDEVRRFYVGEYDPTNPRHIWILDQLGITDEDLRNLEG